MTLVDDNHKFVFIHIPKTGGVSIGHMVHRDTIKKVLPPHSKLSYFRDNVPNYSDYDGYFKFAVVRNPFDWILSHYYQLKGTKWIGDRTFSQFAVWFISHDTPDAIKARSFYGIHYKNRCPPQSDYISHDIDFIGRYESFELTAQMIHEKIFHSKPLIIPWSGRCRQKQGRKPTNYMEHYDSKTEKFVRQFFSEDFERFGYDRDLRSVTNSYRLRMKRWLNQ